MEAKAKSRNGMSVTTAIIIGTGLVLVAVGCLGVMWEAFNG